MSFDDYDDNTYLSDLDLDAMFEPRGMTLGALLAERARKEERARELQELDEMLAMDRWMDTYDFPIEEQFFCDFQGVLPIIRSNLRVRGIKGSISFLKSLKDIHREPFFLGDISFVKRNVRRAERRLNKILLKEDMDQHEEELLKPNRYWEMRKVA